MTRKAHRAKPRGQARKSKAQGRPPNAAERMERFALGYFAEPNATKAALEAGYAESSAHVQGNRLLRNDKVVTRLRQLGEQAASAKIAQAQERQEFLTAVMRGEVSDHALSFGEVKAVPASVQNRLKAAEQLSKMQGTFVERHVLSGPNDGPIQTEQLNGIPEEDRAQRLADLFARAQKRSHADG